MNQPSPPQQSWGKSTNNSIRFFENKLSIIHEKTIFIIEKMKETGSNRQVLKEEITQLSNQEEILSNIIEALYKSFITERRKYYQSFFNEAYQIANGETIIPKCRNKNTEINKTKKEFVNNRRQVLDLVELCKNNDEQILSIRDYVFDPMLTQDENGKFPHDYITSVDLKRKFKEAVTRTLNSKYQSIVKSDNEKSKALLAMFTDDGLSKVMDCCPNNVRYRIIDARVNLVKLSKNNSNKLLDCDFTLEDMFVPDECGILPFYLITDRNLINKLRPRIALKFGMEYWMLIKEQRYHHAKLLHQFSCMVCMEKQTKYLKEFTELMKIDVLQPILQEHIRSHNDVFRGI